MASQKYASSSSSHATAASAFPIDKPNSHMSSDNHLWLGPRGSGGKARWQFYGSTVFTYYSQIGGSLDPWTLFFQDGKICTCLYVLITIFLPGPNSLYPEDLIPFTRYPLFLVIDSENSHAFKAGLSELNLGLQKKTITMGILLFLNVKNITRVLT